MSQSASAGGAGPPAAHGAAPPASEAKSGGRYIPPAAVWIVAGVCTAGIVWVRAFCEIPLVDEAVRNIITLILSFVALMSGLIWFAWRSAYPRLPAVDGGGDPGARGGRGRRDPADR